MHRENIAKELNSFCRICIIASLMVFQLPCKSGAAEYLNKPHAKFTGSVGGGPVTTTVDLNSNGKRVGLNIGDELDIQLEANGSTGYQWYFDELGTAADLFEPIAEDRIQTAASSGAVGSPMVHVWKIKAIKSGSSIIRMKYYRIWEGSARAIKQFEIGININ